MKKIGLIVAVEMESVFRIFGKATREKKEYGFKVYEYDLDNLTLVICESGAGEIGAAAATQHIIVKYGVEAVINFGIVGGLSEDIHVFDTCIVENVVHYDYDITEAEDCKVGQYFGRSDVFFATDESLNKLALTHYPDLKKVNCASGDKFVAAREKRIKLGTDFNCDICEMEAAGILMICKRNHIPCMMIKTVSDGIDDRADEFFVQADEASDKCFEIIKGLIKHI